jgi:membrane-bound serine protease (ClpP class)
MNSYLGAKIRAFSGEQPMRAEVLEAMMNPDFELTIDDKVIKPKGKLLTLTAREAMATYGDPPTRLLATGIAATIDDLLRQEYGETGYTARTLEITWSERLAVLLRAISPVLLGVGLLGLYIEFKTPGFGIFGIAGIICLVTVFLSNYVAGLSGHEPMLVFAIGLLLVFLEILLFPGVVFVALTGMLLMLGSLIWSMADIWPNEPLQFSGEIFLTPLRDLSLGLLVATALALALARFIPTGWFFSRLAVGSPISGSAQFAGSAPEAGATGAGLVGRIGVAATGLYPAGQIEVDGHRYEARLEVGSAPPGTRIVVRRKTDFGYLVDREEAQGA